MTAHIRRLLISITPDEKQALTRLAEYEGRLSLTATIRHLIKEAARQRGIWPSYSPDEGYQDHHSEIHEDD